MNDLDMALAAVRVLHDQSASNAEARKLALHVLGEFVRFHTPAAAQQIRVGLDELLRLSSVKCVTPPDWMEGQRYAGVNYGDL